MNIAVEPPGTAVEGRHGGRATFVQSVPIRETFDGAPVDLADKPNATRAYARSSPVEGSDRCRFVAVLHMGAIKSPAAAVRAAIVVEHRERR